MVKDEQEIFLCLFIIFSVYGFSAKNNFFNLTFKNFEHKFYYTRPNLQGFENLGLDDNKLLKAILNRVTRLEHLFCFQVSA